MQITLDEQHLLGLFDVLYLGEFLELELVLSQYGGCALVPAVDHRLLVRVHEERVEIVRVVHLKL